MQSELYMGRTPLRVDERRTMKSAVAALLLLATVPGTPALAGDRYTTKYDHVDLEEMIHNPRLFDKYFDCIVGVGKCTPDAKLLKEVIPDALLTECSKCSERQKAGTEKVLRFLLEKKPDKYAQLEKIYDPNGEYKAKYAVEAKKRALKLPQADSTD